MADNDELLDQLVDYKRRRRTLNARGGAAMLTGAGEGLAGRDPNRGQAWLPQAPDDPGLTAAQAAELKARLLDTARLMQDAEVARKKQVYEALAAQQALDKEQMRVFGTIMTAAVNGDAALQGAIVNAKARNREATEKAYQEVHTNYVMADPGLKDAFSDLDAAFTKAENSTGESLNDGSPYRALVGDAGVQQAFVKAYRSAEGTTRQSQPFERW
jgi:hypothetical protein